MSTILLVKACMDEKKETLFWQYADEKKQKPNLRVKLDDDSAKDSFLMRNVSVGDVWKAQAVSRKTSGRNTTVTVKLLALNRKQPEWLQIKEIPGFWMPSDILENIMIWFNTMTDIIAIGPAGSGKTSFPYMLARTLGWQEPFKVDMAMMKRTNDLFGSDAAKDGSTLFRESPLLSYIKRARASEKAGLPDQFIVILDEINRLHAKSNEGLHGLFDDTRQISLTTTEGGILIKLPGNIHFWATMNQGSEYLGTFGLDQAIKDRFAAVKIERMPFDYEVALLAKEEQIQKEDAHDIVRVAEELRKAADAGELSFSPSYRYSRNVARLVRFGKPIIQACISGFFGWYDGTLKLNKEGEPVDADSEVARAFSAIRMSKIENRRSKVSKDIVLKPLSV